MFSLSANLLFIPFKQRPTMYYYFWMGIQVLIIIILILSHDHMISKRTRFWRYYFQKFSNKASYPLSFGIKMLGSEKKNLYYEVKNIILGKYKLNIPRKSFFFQDHWTSNVIQILEKYSRSTWRNLYGSYLYLFLGFRLITKSYSVLSTLPFKARWEFQLFQLESVLILTRCMINFSGPPSNFVEPQLISMLHRVTVLSFYWQYAILWWNTLIMEIRLLK